MTAETPSPAGDSSRVLWFYRTEQGKVGPFGIAELSEKLASAAIPAETPVWRHGFDAWLPASECLELADAVAANRVSSVSRQAASPRGPSKTVVAAVVAIAALASWPVIARLFWSMSVAHVNGTVTTATEPVRGGSVILSPIGTGASDAPGKPGVAAVGQDGRFALRLDPGAGGLARRYAVRFVPPVLPPMSEAEAMRAVPPYNGFVPTTRELDIHAGANTVAIEIGPAASGGTDRSPR